MLNYQRVSILNVLITVLKDHQSFRYLSCGLCKGLLSLWYSKGQRTDSTLYEKFAIMFKRKLQLLQKCLVTVHSQSFSSCLLAYRFVLSTLQKCNLKMLLATAASHAGCIRSPDRQARTEQKSLRRHGSQLTRLLQS